MLLGSGRKILLAGKKKSPPRPLVRYILEEEKGKLEKLLKISKAENRGLQVRIERGQLVLYREERFPGQETEWLRAIRLTPLGNRTYGLSVYSKSNRWEKTPFTGGLRELVNVMTTDLAHFLGSPW